MPITIRRKVVAPPPDPIAHVPERRVTAVQANLDQECLWVMGQSPHAAIPWFLMASYLYYHHDVSLISDGLYDDMAKAILEAWDELDHRHKHLLSEDALKAGSLYSLRVEDYPGMTKGGARHLIKTHMGLSIPEI